MLKMFTELIEYKELLWAFTNKNIVDVLLTFGIFFTPVFYEASIFGKWKPLIPLNPMGAILENINNVVVLHRAPELFWLAYAGLWSIGGLIGAWIFFYRSEELFAGNISNLTSC